MIPYIGCDVARQMLEPFVDGELPMPQQVALESHLRWCATCGARVEDMRLIGASLRLGSPVPASDEDAAASLTAIQAGVLARVRAERDQSFAVQFRRMFEDAHFMWPALGASIALTVCVLAVLGINQAARSVDRDSMADRIQTLASPGSDRNPLHLDSWMLAPALLTESPMLEAMPADEAMIAVAAIVTREGRVSGYEVLSDRTDGGASEGRVVNGVIDVVKQSRFTPAQNGQGPVAVNMVWVLERTTVKAPLSLNLGALAPLQPIPDVVVRPISAQPAPPVLRPARS